MIKINDKSLFVGQIKQVLKDFNLPKCHCNDNILVKDNYYIKGNRLFYVEEKNGDLSLSNKSVNYVFGKEYLNITKNLNFESLYYDLPTHIYLGEYLRFIRDFKGVDLMPLYNCSMDKILNYPLSLIDDSDKVVVWDSSKFDIYVVPIKFNQKYTIGVAYDKIEVCAALYDYDNFTLLTNEEDTKLLYTSSHTILRNCDFSHPAVYDKLDSFYSKNTAHLFQKEGLLKLFIKVPKGYRGEVVVLEGDYLKGCQVNISTQTIPTDYVFSDSYDVRNIKLLSNNHIRPQLLSEENNDKYVLSDRLIEYLTGNVICPLSEPYDIEKLQNWMLYNGDQLLEKGYISKKLSSVYKGIWTNDMSRFLFELINVIDGNYTKVPYDTLGYLDKDLEKKLEYLGDEDFNKELYIKYGGIV